MAGAPGVAKERRGVPIPSVVCVAGNCGGAGWLEKRQGEREGAS